MTGQQPCPHHARGRCNWGEKCKYSHDIPKPICQHFAKFGRCGYGKDCRFSHDCSSDSGDDNQNKTPAQTEDQKKLDQLYKRWELMKPQNMTRIIPLKEHELVKFFEQALQLVEAGGKHMQGVIEALASSEGLVRVRELLRRKWAELTDESVTRVMPTLVSFFTILSHRNVRQSAVIETRYGNLLNELYGIGGQQAAAVFSATARYMTDRDDQAELEIAIAAFACMLEMTDVAMASPGLQAAAEVLLALLDHGGSRSRSTQRHIRTITTKLELAAQLEEAPRQPIKSAMGPKATFEIEQDMPGPLSRDGRRHDNDWEDIGDIKILPTSEEIQCTRAEYLPREDPSQWHIAGLRGLIDRHFRLVREDSIGPIRDALTPMLEQPQISKPTTHQNAARTRKYENVRLERIGSDDRKGLLFVLSFDQPAGIMGKSAYHQRTWWDESERLVGDSLVCLVSATEGTSFFLVVHSPSPHPRSRRKSYYDDSEEEEEIYEEPLHELYKLWSDKLRAHVIVELPNSVPEDATSFIKACVTQDMAPDSTLVEFPGVILAAFGPSLKALQDMAQHQDMPFTDILVPGGASVEKSPPPAYSQRNNFKFDLGCLLKDDESNTDATASTESEIQSVLEKSTLDDAQSIAVSHALTSSVSLIQGPPGTGKSYTGVKLIQALLANREKTDLGPVVCVCYTNHALDQLLEHLTDAGVEQMVRVGTRCKSERLAGINLRKLIMESDKTRLECSKWGQTMGSMSGAIIRAARVVDEMTDEATATMTWLRDNHEDVHAQIKSDFDEDGFERVTGKKPAIQTWLHGGIMHGRPRALDDLLENELSFHTLINEERKILYDHWSREAMSEQFDELEIQLQSFHNHKESLESIRGEQELRILSDASVIGITTSGLARSLKHLRKLTSKVLVVEEAGEVLEAHLLTAMLPSLEHAILIGDHQQLRPKVSNYDLSVENHRSKVALDVSLFERLVQPHSGETQGLPFVTLETQRRMHPSISQLIRSTHYPALVDAANVSEYPEVSGMRQRLFWLDHQENEDGKSKQSDSLSHTNSFEVEMVTALVRHLQRQGVYEASEIAVLTPYLGQLRKLRTRLSEFVDIVVNDRDVEALAREGKTMVPLGDKASSRPVVAKGNLIDALRVATVDNFQGEEAKVVIISLVRSNAERKCGFLRTSNRINVLLSRAKHGMYIIGNAATSGMVPMWQDVIDLLKQTDSIGPVLELACPRHLDTPLQVKHPDDFNIVAPQAGCNLMCGKQLHCGHSCPMNCHSDSLHHAVHCLKDCPRPKKGCEHPCRLACGDECKAICTEMVKRDVQLPCGHQVTSLPCHLYQDPKKVECQVKVEKTVPGCGHKVTMKCCEPVDHSSFQCRKLCSEQLDCGHECRRLCYMCRPRGYIDGHIIKTDHGTCSIVCGKPYSSCEHSCQATCHGGDDNHPLCSMPCNVSCAHAKCPKKCSEPCTPCAEETCPSQCPHTFCRMPCAAPCDHVPCNKRCEKRLACGHQCPSLCGEICPSKKMCQVCATAMVKDIRVDLITFETYRDVDLNQTPCFFLPCGHVFTAESLDMQLELKLHYDLDDAGLPIAVKGDLEPFSVEKMKCCPDCRGSLRSIARYGAVVRRSLLDINTRKFIVWSNRKYTTLAEGLQSQQASFALIAHGSEVTLHGLEIVGDLPKVLKNAGRRYTAILQLRKDIQAFLHDVSKEEQPYQKVHDLVKAARRRQLEDSDLHKAIDEFQFDKQVLQTRGELLATALMHRCDLIAITDLLKQWEEDSDAKKHEVHVDLSSNRNACRRLLAAATESKNVLQQAEANIFWAHFAALECAAASASHTSAQDMDRLKRQAAPYLDAAQALCDEFSGPTKSVTGEVDAVRKMLRDSVSRSEMRMVVAAMEKEFSGTGHWYYCVNRHPFTVGECGMPMELARCPQCGAEIGGLRHRATEGVTHAGDIERDFGRLRI